MLALFSGQAMAQRTLPCMKTVEVKASMVDGFYTGNSRNCGYSFGVYYSVFKGNNVHEWIFGGEYLQTYKPYGEKERIPVADFTAEAGYNLHLISDYSQTFHLYAGISALAGYETVNWGESVLKDGATLQANDAFIYGGAVNKSSVYKKLNRVDTNVYKEYTSHCHYKGKWHKQLNERRRMEYSLLFNP